MLTELIRQKAECVWRNPHRISVQDANRNCPFSLLDIQDAAERWKRFCPYFIKAFPETAALNGIVESPLREIPAMKKALEGESGRTFNGRLFLKMDSHLPVSGSVKARGGVYEVLKYAEDLALENGFLKKEDSYDLLFTSEAKEFFSRYSVAVGSTGNLGLSIGIIGAALGFQVTVHMSADARPWKKNLLRQNGVTVLEYDSDYSEAVRQGRLSAERDPFCHFVDDENSSTLFLGYSVAALRLKEQLERCGIPVDIEHPLMVYLPCGVGGAPGGIAFGIKQIFGDAAQVFFAEPTAAPCMILGMATGLHSQISISDLGLSVETQADGLAVGRPSGFVGKIMEPYLCGCYTLSDERMLRMLRILSDSENISLEPSALAGMYGPLVISGNAAFSDVLENKTPTHVVWATGGNMVPKEEMDEYGKQGENLFLQW